MAYLLVHQNVADFTKWKQGFDEHQAMREAAGSKGGQVLQSADDPNEVIVMMEWDTVEKARAFAQSDDLRQAMERAGVTSPPRIHFLELAYSPSA